MREYDEISTPFVPFEHVVAQRHPSLALTPGAVPALNDTARCEATLVFADLFGFCAFSEARDIEQVAAVMEAIKLEATRIVHAHGGIVNQFVGDEVVALFGFPKGKEDASRRAIEAALELHGFVRSANLGHWRAQDGSLCLHTGIDAGVVLVRTRDVRNGLFELTGAAVNRAARLRSAAGADEILVSQRVHARIAPYFRSEQLGAHSFKGIAESSTPYRIDSCREAAPARPTPPSTPISARSELAELRRFWLERAPDAGGGLVLVAGPAGSGKSRLLESFGAQLAHEGVRVLRACGQDEQRKPFSSLTHLLQLQYSQLEHSHAALVSATVDHLVGEVERSATPHAVLIDDAQWLDVSSRAVLVQVAQRLCPLGHVFVCAARDDERSREQLDQLRSLVAPARSAEIVLGPLRADDAARLVAEYLDLPQLLAPQLVEQLSSLNDGTPLSLLELLELLLENSYLQRRHGAWHLAAEPLRDLQRAASARALIERRIRGLQSDTVRVLTAAAIARGHIEVGLLARATQRNVERVQAALDDASVARLIQLDDRGNPRFSHDMIWEVLLARMSNDEQRRWHQRLACAMREQPESSDTYVFALAQHCAEGVLEEDTRGAFEALRAAATLALAGCDDALALTFLRPAELAAQRAAFDPGPAFYTELGEASLRVGELQTAFASFEAAAERCAPGFERAHLLGQMAWIRHFHAEGSRPLAMLEAALEECGVPEAARDWSMLANAAAAWSWRTLPVSGRAALSAREAEILGGLYIQYSRVSYESARPLRGTAAFFRLAALARDLPPSRVRVKCEVMVAFALAVSGAPARSRAFFERAFSMARALEDPVALAFCHQIAHTGAAWQGEFCESELHAEACVDQRGQYMELGELCQLCFGMTILELFRGRIEHALAWAQRAIERVLHAGHAPAVFALVEEAACSVLVGLGREEEILRLKSRIRFVKRVPLGDAGYFYQVSLLFRAQALAGRDDPGEELERLVGEFARLELDPARVHMGIVVFYALVAHMRVHQCLRAGASERPAYVEKLARALADVRASERIRAQAAHTQVLRGAYAWLCGQVRKAEKLLSEAEGSAREAGIVSVNYSAARLRAHMLRARGKHDEALDQARVAALFARQYGQHASLRFVRDEFALGE